jgi:polyisoprenoid-binding protein YceI
MAESTTTESALENGSFRLEPGSSKIEFSVPHFYGLMKVRGHFEDYAAKLDLAADPAITLTVDAASITTGNQKRDKHLRSKDFFDVSEYPTLSFSSTSAELRGDVLQVRGTLEAVGHELAIELPLRIVPDGNGHAVEATLEIDQRRLGLTWSPAGITRTPTTISLRGRLLR